MRHSLIPLGVFLLAAPSSLAHEVDAWSQTTPTGVEVHVRVTGDPGQPFAVYTSADQGADFDPSTASFLRAGVLDPLGRGQVILPSARNLPPTFGIQIHALVREVGGLSATGTWLPLSGGAGTLCQLYDPNHELGPDQPVAGEFIADQWDLVNMAVSGVANGGLGPDAVIVFDSANPTGGDTDLATPGYGPNNSVAYGNLLILPDNVDDLDMDGLVDDPNDNPDGGVMRFDFAEPYRMCSATLVDIDDGGGSELRFYIGPGMTLETIPLADMGDNSVQTVTFDKRDVRRFEIALQGSGALARLEMVPCPLLVNLDETPFGAPRPEQAGSIITDQYQDLGLTVSAMNNTPFHPDLLILFDSENPTGGDFDLMTPGPGINNDTPLGLVMIIAENDVDADMNGLVDDPDDEAGGGQMLFEFSEDITFFNATVLDVDGVERDVFTFFDEVGAPITILEIDALGDNSVQSLDPPAPIENVRAIQVNLVGSGALTRLRWCPSSNVSGGSSN